MSDLDTLMAKDGIVTVVHRLFIATDQRDWPAQRVREMLCREIPDEAKHREDSSEQ